MSTSTLSEENLAAPSLASSQSDIVDAMNWFQKLFTLKRILSTSGNHGHEQHDMNDDPAYKANADVVHGSSFTATLHVTTPLSVLIHHGELFRGSPNNAPAYGNQAQGIWLWKTKSWAEMGAKNVPESPLSPQATDIGPQAAEDYLPFLIQFRQIFEKAGSDEQKLAELQSLSTGSHAFASFWTKLEEVYVDFPRCLFYRPLLTLPGVGSKTAQNLYNGGYRTVEQVLSADTAQLKKVPGIGPKLAAKIKGLE